MTNNQASTSHPRTRSQTRRLPTVVEAADPTVEEQVQALAETQREILRLLQAQTPVSAQWGRSLPQQEEIPSDDAYREFSLQVYSQQRRDDGLLDIASTSHPFEHVWKMLGGNGQTYFPISCGPTKLPREHLLEKLHTIFVSEQKPSSLLTLE